MAEGSQTAKETGWFGGVMASLDSAFDTSALAERVRSLASKTATDATEIFSHTPAEASEVLSKTATDASAKAAEMKAAAAANIAKAAAASAQAEGSMKLEQTVKEFLEVVGEPSPHECAVADLVPLLRHAGLHLLHAKAAAEQATASYRSQAEQAMERGKAYKAAARTEAERAEQASCANRELQERLAHALGELEVARKRIAELEQAAGGAGRADTANSLLTLTGDVLCDDEGSMGNDLKDEVAGPNEPRPLRVQDEGCDSFAPHHFQFAQAIKCNLETS
ncbi:hypothetical protein AB1Y20_006007 [Prymnesium parvum]|uniref:Uncharacterized protein n=1 Tax=Prymnesium parvum TaxID=97485 RepID=A0AB34J4I4_PRYPA